jgi:hypothetical protein
VTRWGVFCKPKTLRNHPALDKPVSSDTASLRNSMVLQAL